MEEKLKIIDKITAKHPSYGVDKGWSWYVGGMRDTGNWNLRMMLDLPIEELQDFFDNILAQEDRANEKTKQELDRRAALTEEERNREDTIIPFGHGGWCTTKFKEDFEKWGRERDMELWFKLLKKDK